MIENKYVPEIYELEISYFVRGKFRKSKRRMLVDEDFFGGAGTTVLNHLSPMEKRYINHYPLYAKIEDVKDGWASYVKCDPGGGFMFAGEVDELDCYKTERTYLKAYRLKEEREKAKEIELQSEKTS